MSVHLTPRQRLLALVLTPLLILGVVAGVWAATRQSPIVQRPVTQGDLPAGIPTHFSFGVESGLHGTADLNDMRTRNGTAWEARYQYLAAGVNTGAGWQTWEQPGQFATLYLQESQQNNYLPTFVYYMLLQSNGPNGDGSEKGKDLAHLADPGVMKAYYADWTQLMRDIGKYGKPTLVVVEPDLWGYVEQAAADHQDDAAGVPASVASSGNADLTGYPDNAAGFARALLHLRDKYAPNAILTLHVSIWGTGTDLGRDTNASLDVATLARRQASFLATAGLQAANGVSTFDLLSIDIADRDSGETGVWWDPTNKAPNSFNRFLRYAAALSAETERRIVLWQVPIGNQVYQTEDNTHGTLSGQQGAIHPRTRGRFRARWRRDDALRRGQRRGIACDRSARRCCHQSCVRSRLPVRPLQQREERVRRRRRWLPAPHGRAILQERPVPAAWRRFPAHRAMRSALVMLYCRMRKGAL